MEQFGGKFTAAVNRPAGCDYVVKRQFRGVLLREIRRITTRQRSTLPSLHTSSTVVLIIVRCEYVHKTTKIVSTGDVILSKMAAPVASRPTFKLDEHRTVVVWYQSEHLLVDRRIK